MERAAGLIDPRARLDPDPRVRRAIHFLRASRIMQTRTRKEVQLAFIRRTPGHAMVVSASFGALEDRYIRAAIAALA